MGALDGWRFCPRCGKTLTPQEKSVVCPSCGAGFWANPVPGAQALVERDGRVLLGRRRHDPSAGLWDIPGGFVDEDEHPIGALRRELRWFAPSELPAPEELAFETFVEILLLWRRRHQHA